MKTVKVTLLFLVIIGSFIFLIKNLWTPIFADRILSFEKKSDVISQAINKKTAQVQTNSNSETYPPNITPLASSTKIHVLISPESVLSGTTTAPGIPPSKYGIKIEVSASQEESGTGLFGDAYLNGKEIAQGIPVYSTFEGTSPDLTYYAYRSLSHASAGSSYIGIEVFNQHTEEYTHIETPPGENVSKYISDSRIKSWYYVMPYIESYAWENDHSINFVFYYLAWATTERVSPREIWNYDFITKQYTLTSAEE